MKQDANFYIKRPEGAVAGPYDLVQMAGLYRKKIIMAETMTRLDGKEEWMPFGEQPLYIVVLEIPADATSMRIEALNEEAQTPNSLIPLPSSETLGKLGMMIFLLLIAGGVGFFFGYFDSITGNILAVVGVAVAAVGQCLILARLLEEDFTILGMVFFIPFFDIYYFLSNIWEYFPYICAKYVGVVLALSAAAGMATAGHN